MSTTEMKRSKQYRSVPSIFLFTLAALFFLSACGGGEKGGLDAKKAELATLKTERKAINTNIRTLEKEIAELDTNVVTDTRVPVKVTSLAETTFEHFVKVQGAIEADNNVMVSAQMAGMLKNIRVKEGQRVSRGQLLGNVDSDIMRKALEELKVQLTLADTVYSRQRNLWNQKIGSEIQLLQAETNKKALETRIATTKEQISMSEIRSPISGVVENVMPKVGEVIAPGIPVFNIINLSKLSFKAALSESYIPYIKRGDKVKINFAVIGKVIDAKISNVSQNINPMNRTVMVEAALTGNNEMLKANMSGEISINDASNENAIVVPINQIQNVGDKEFAMIAVAGENGALVAKKVEVTTGLSYQGNIEVLSGLSKGSQLITQGGAGLLEGTPVVLTGK